MNKIIKVGIIGCGRVAEHYADILVNKKIKGIKIIFCCDIKISKAKKMAKKFNTEFFSDFHKVPLSQKIDLVFILTESGRHFEHAKYFLSKKINVLVEKPATFNYSDSKKLYEISKKNNLICAVGFQNRLNPAIKKLKKILLEKRLGKLVTASVKINWCRNQSYYNDGWHGSWLMDGGVTNQQAIHHVDILTYLFGSPIKVGSFMRNSLNKLEAEDTSVAIIQFKSNLITTFEATTAARPKDFEASLTVVGEKGRIKIGGIALNKILNWDFVNKKKSDENVRIKYSQYVKNGYGLSHVELINNLIYNLKNKKLIKELPTINSTFSTTNLISGLYKSFENNKIIVINNKTRSRKLGKQ